MSFIDDGKTLLKLVQDAGNADIKREFVNYQMQTATVYVESLAKDERIAELEKRLKIKGDLHYGKNSFGLIVMR